MVESLMLIALGFLTATLFAIIAIQFMWRRAVAVTTARLLGELKNEDMQAHEAAKAASDRIASLEATLTDKSSQIVELLAGNTAFAERNAQLERTIAEVAEEAEAKRQEIVELHAHREAAARDAETLRHEIANLQGECDAARAEAERQAQALVTLQSHADMLRQRIGELEQAASVEIGRQAGVERQLKALGEKAARLVYEMTETFGHVADTSGLQAAIAVEEPAEKIRSAMEPAGKPSPESIALTPYPAEGFEELKAIKASLSSGFDESVDVDNDHAPEDMLPGEHMLAERIKALEAGVAS